jgi:hypothetical protein
MATVRNFEVPSNRFNVDEISILDVFRKGKVMMMIIIIMIIIIMS